MFDTDQSSRRLESLEAGALSKIIKASLVCTFLIDLEPSDVDGPLAQFQHTRATKDDVLNLLKTLNHAVPQDATLPEAHLEEALEVWWPKLDQELQRLPPEDVASRPRRSERDLLEEILDLVRNQTRAASPVTDEEDRDSILSNRVNKVLFAKATDVASVSNYRDGATLVTTIRLKAGGQYNVIIPRNIAYEEIEPVVISQIQQSPTAPTIVSSTSN